jgi:hypothetical protein
VQRGVPGSFARSIRDLLLVENRQTKDHDPDHQHEKERGDKRKFDE